MKILRTRRGFTTNSSSASEWSSTTPQASKSQSTSPTSPNNSPSASATKTPLPVGATVELSAAPSSAQDLAHQQSAFEGVGLLGLGVLVVGAFFGERIVRQLISKKKK